MRIGSLVHARRDRVSLSRGCRGRGIVISWRPSRDGAGDRIFKVLFVDGNTMEFYACGLNVISL